LSYPGFMAVISLTMADNLNNAAALKEDAQAIVDLEFDYYLFEVYLNDMVEHEIQRMMQFTSELEKQTQ